MKKNLILLFLFALFSLPAFAGHWALRHVSSGEYLYSKEGQLALAVEFSLTDPSFSWLLEPQTDGSLRIQSGACAKYLASTGDGSLSPIAEDWTVTTTADQLYRTLKGKEGTLKVYGTDLWRIEPVAGLVDLKGRGAKITWTEYQAEHGDFRGVLIGPSTELQDPASEAVGRMAVKLEQTGDRVSWIAEADADGLELRYSIPDAPKGGGMDATLSFYINGQKSESIPLTSRHAWIYGEGHSASRFWTDDPNNGTPRKHFDTQRFRLKQPVLAGDLVELRRESTDDAAFYIIDMIELEKIPAMGERPEGFLSITDFGAVANDGKDDSEALSQSLSQAADMGAAGVWVPAGIFDFFPKEPIPEDVPGNPDQTLYQRFPLSDIHLKGAGAWHSELRGNGIAFQCGTRWQVSDLAIDWQGESRRSAMLFFGRTGQDSGFSNLYITRCGLVLSIYDPDSRNFTVRNSRIRSTFAGGINLRGGHRNALIENVHTRGTGDDALIFWSTKSEKSAQPTRDSVIRNCTVEVPWNGNCYLMAGGENNLLKDCVGVDAIRHSGVRITTQIYIAHTMPFSGVNRLEGVSLLRCGSDKHGAYNGAIQVEAHGHPVESIEIADCDIFASPYAAIQIYNKIDERGQGGLEMSCVITDCTVTGAALAGLHLGPDTPGHVEVNNTQFSSCMLGDIQNDSETAKLIVKP